MNHFDTVREHLEDIASEGWTFQITAREWAQQALSALAQIEADHFTAADMASAAAQGFRDGVASVQQGEPYGWHYWNNGGASVLHRGPSNRLDADIEAAKQNPKAHHVVPLYTAPIAQQPQAEAVLSDDLHTFLDVAAGEGLVLGNVDAADLYIELFPERYAAAIAAQGEKP